MKKLLTLVLVLVMAMAVCASGASAVTIACSPIGQESDWRTATTDSVNSAIEGHEGWELV